MSHQAQYLQSTTRTRDQNKSPCIDSVELRRAELSMLRVEKQRLESKIAALGVSGSEVKSHSSRAPSRGPLVPLLSLNRIHSSPKEDEEEWWISDRSHESVKPNFDDDLAELIVSARTPKERKENEIVNGNQTCAFPLCW